MSGAGRRRTVRAGGRVVAIDAIGGHAAAALVVQGRLEDLVVDPPPERGPRPGAIFRAVPGRPMKGLGGMFVDLGLAGRGFLRDARGVAPGRPILVQVQALPEPGKAPPVTRRLLIKGRSAIVTPDAPGVNVSRAVRGRELRAALEEIGTEALGESERPLGLILRRAAGGLDPAEVRDEIGRLLELATALLADTEGGPELLLDGPDPAEWAWREWSVPAPGEWLERPGAFAELGLEDEIDALRRPEVALPGGAFMSIEPTRALVAVDVNTAADASPAAALKATLAAIRELPRQLRLRGLGGQIVIDPAPIARKDRREVEAAIGRAFRDEPVSTTFAGWTALGNIELSRRRERWAWPAEAGSSP